ncbi:MAG: hypothetical protein JXC85_00445 [Candidatus Aenigmarchaeota archaeon]|nr:hypothetical protein [Candidatus Aenigmarchaeota archaeon]
MKEFSFPLAAAFFFISICIMGISAEAAELDYYGIETVVNQNFMVSTTTILIFDTPINHLDYNLDFNIDNLSVRTLSGTNRCSFENVGGGSVIKCDFFSMSPEDTTIKLSFATTNAVKRVGDDYEFRATYPISMKTDRMFSIIKLPPKGVLAAEVANESFFPPDGNVLTDGKHMIVSWEKKNLTVDDSLSFSVLFEVVGAGGIMWDFLIFGLTALVIIAMVLIAVYMRRGAGPVQKEVKVLPLLNKDEKRIVDIVAKEGGEARQRLLVKQTDFSKAKVSRLIKNLKERGVVDTVPISGRENKVILKIKGVGE